MKQSQVTANIVIKSQNSNEFKEIEETCWIDIHTTTQQFIQQLTSTLGSDYVLYETAFVKSASAKNNNDLIERKFIRQLHAQEFPCVVQENWKYNPHDPSIVHYTFFLCPKDHSNDNSVFAALRKEACRVLPLDKLYKRLSMLDKQEEDQINAIKKKYALHKQAITNSL